MNTSRISIVLMTAAILCLSYIMLWFVGVTPASEQERQAIGMMKKSEVSHNYKIAAVLRAIDESAYISHGDFNLAVDVFINETSHQQ